jgi:hypothetical protein
VEFKDLSWVSDELGRGHKPYGTVKALYAKSPLDVIVEAQRDHGVGYVLCDASFYAKTDCEKDLNIERTFDGYTNFIWASGDTIVANLKIWWVASSCDGIVAQGGSCPDQSKSGRDTMNVTVRIHPSLSGGEVQRYGSLYWTRDFQVSASGASTAPAYSNVTVTGMVPSSGGWQSGNYSTPLTYSWKFNGSSVCGSGTVSPNQSKTCTRQIGGEGSYSTWQFIVTDAEGDVVSKEHVVQGAFRSGP